MGAALTDARRQHNLAPEMHACARAAGAAAGGAPAITTPLPDAVNARTAAFSAVVHSVSAGASSTSTDEALPVPSCAGVTA